MSLYMNPRVSQDDRNTNWESFCVLFNLQQAFMVRISALHIDLYLCPSCKLARFLLNIDIPCLMQSHVMITGSKKAPSLMPVPGGTMG